MSLTLDTKTYDNDVARSPDSYRYLGPDHSSEFNDFVDLYRATAPVGDVGKVKSRGRFKLTRSVTDGTDKLATDMIIDVQVVIPTGSDGTEVDAVIDEAAAFVAHADFAALCKSAIINT
jgi:hypothetical protein